MFNKIFVANYANYVELKNQSNLYKILRLLAIVNGTKRLHGIVCKNHGMFENHTYETLS